MYTLSNYKGNNARIRGLSQAFHTPRPDRQDQGIDSVKEVPLSLALLLLLALQEKTWFILINIILLR